MNKLRFYWYAFKHLIGISPFTPQQQMVRDTMIKYGFKEVR